MGFEELKTFFLSKRLGCGRELNYELRTDIVAIIDINSEPMCL